MARAARALRRAPPNTGGPGGSGRNDRARVAKPRPVDWHSNSRRQLRPATGTPACVASRPIGTESVGGAKEIVQRGLGARLLVDFLDDDGAVQRVLAVLRRQIARDHDGACGHAAVMDLARLAVVDLACSGRGRRPCRARCRARR